MEKNVHTFQKILMKKKSEEKSGFFFYNFVDQIGIYIYKYN